MKSKKKKGIRLSTLYLLIGAAFWGFIMWGIYRGDPVVIISLLVTYFVISVAAVIELVEEIMDRPVIALHVDTEAEPPVLIKVVGDEEKIYEPRKKNEEENNEK